MKVLPLFRARQGASMLVVLMVLTGLSACVISSLNFTSVVSRDVQRSNALRAAVEIGDGIFDYQFAYWRERCRIPEPHIQLPASSFSIPLPTGGLFPFLQNFNASRGNNPNPGTPFTVADYKIVATDQFFNPLPDNAEPSPQHGMTYGTRSYHYKATATITLPAIGGKVDVKMSRIFTKALTSPWNYAIFYIDDLEMHPGAMQEVTGWVHTNARLYTGHNTLQFQSKVSYGDDWSRNFKPGDSRYSTETPTSPSWPSNLAPFRDQGQQPFGLDAMRIFNTTDASANNDSYRELVERPSSTDSDIVDSARYYNQADVKVLVNNAGDITLRRKDGTTINGSSTGNDLKLYNAIRPALSVGVSITDKREAALVRLIDVDVGILHTALTATTTPSYTPPIFNKILYISDSSGSATVKRAVRLKKGSIIPKGGLTFATDNGLYIQGDFNTGRTGGTEPPSNYTSGADPTRPTVASYIRQPCAVLADAVMILSNGWSDGNSNSALSNRLATPTTVNTAIVSGIVPTSGTAGSPGNYSGGAENFPRFLERWSGDTFTYYGSMVELYTSRQFNTPWKGTGDGPQVYDAPIRRWYFDNNFFSTPPPGSLMIVSYSKGRWSRE